MDSSVSGSGSRIQLDMMLGRQAMLYERSGYMTNIQKGTYLMWKEGLNHKGGQAAVLLADDWTVES